MYIMLIFFFNDTATTEIYTLSLHDALPIFGVERRARPAAGHLDFNCPPELAGLHVMVVEGEEDSRDLIRQVLEKCGDRKSTRLNSSHANISYAVFCLEKKKKKHKNNHLNRQ